MGDATRPEGVGARISASGTNSTSDAFNQSAIRTVIVAGITSNLRLGAAPGNVMLRKRDSHLAKDSVVNVSQLLTLSKHFLVDRIGRIPPTRIREVDGGLRLVLSL